jgi:hypothetical protein
VQSSNGLIGSGFSFYVACGLLGAVLFGLIIWQPKAGSWVAKVVEADSSNTQGESEFARPPAVPKRKPIGSTAWTQVVPSNN